MTTLRVPRGDSLILDIDATSSLTGATIRFTAKASLDDADDAAVLAGSTNDGRIVITDGPNGIAVLTIPASATAGFTTDRTLHWDLQVSAGGITRTLDSGLLIVSRDVTRTA